MCVHTSPMDIFQLLGNGQEEKCEMENIGFQGEKEVPLGIPVRGLEKLYGAVQTG